MNSAGYVLLVIRRTLRVAIRRGLLVGVIAFTVVTSGVVTLVLVTLLNALNGDHTQQAPTHATQRDSTSAALTAPTGPRDDRESDQKAQKAENEADRFADWLYQWLAPQTFANLLLVAVGATGMVVGLITLVAVLDQARISARNLELSRRLSAAALRQAAAVELQTYQSLRARMGLQSIVPHGFDTSEPSVGVEFRNFGGKGAYIISSCIAVTSTPLGASPGYFEWDETGKPVEAGDVIWFDCDVTPTKNRPDHWAACLDETSGVRLVIYGALKYRAGFTDDEKIVGFARMYDPRMARRHGDHRSFVGIGGKAYNHAT